MTHLFGWHRHVKQQHLPSAAAGDMDGRHNMAEVSHVHGPSVWCVCMWCVRARGRTALLARPAGHCTPAVKTHTSPQQQPQFFRHEGHKGQGNTGSISTTPPSPRVLCSSAGNRFTINRKHLSRQRKCYSLIGLM